MNHPPLYHFHAPEKKHFPFDPNGAFYCNGEYHLFYLFDDPSISRGKGDECAWGHAVSHDLIHWRFCKPALTACEGEKYIFSGSAFRTRDGGIGLCFYVVGKGISLAFPTDDTFEHWQRADFNPIIPVNMPDDPRTKLYHVYDPHLWLGDDNIYYLLLGGRHRPDYKGDGAFLFASQDLKQWDFRGQFYDVPDSVAPYEDMACPDFFRLGGRDVLLGISHPHGARCYIGERQGDRFRIDVHQRLNHPGGTLFAPESLEDGRGRRIAWFWLLNDFFALPRELRMAPSGSRLLQFVPDEFQTLRAAPIQEFTGVLSAGEFQLLKSTGKTLCWEIKVRTGNGKLRLRLRSGRERDAEHLAAEIDFDAKTLSSDTAKQRVPTNGPNILLGPPEGPKEMPERCSCHPRQTTVCEVQEEGTFGLSLWLDYGVLELFSDDGAAVITQTFTEPEASDAVHLALESTGGVTILQNQVFPIHPK